MLNHVALLAAMTLAGAEGTGTLKNACGPLDGPALELSLTLPSTRAVIQLNQGFLVAPETTLPATVVVKSGENGWVQLCSKKGVCVDAKSATLVIERLGAVIIGRYTIERTGSGSPLSGPFRARRVDAHANCG